MSDSSALEDDLDKLFGELWTSKVAVASFLNEDLDFSTLKALLRLLERLMTNHSYNRPIFDKVYVKVHQKIERLPKYAPETIASSTFVVLQTMKMLIMQRRALEGDDEAYRVVNASICELMTRILLVANSIKFTREALQARGRDFQRGPSISSGRVASYATLHEMESIGGSGGSMLSASVDELRTSAVAYYDNIAHHTPGTDGGGVTCLGSAVAQEMVGWLVAQETAAPGSSLVSQFSKAVTRHFVGSLSKNSTPPLEVPAWAFSKHPSPQVHVAPKDHSAWDCLRDFLVLCGAKSSPLLAKIVSSHCQHLRRTVDAARDQGDNSLHFSPSDSSPLTCAIVESHLEVVLPLLAHAPSSSHRGTSLSRAFRTLVSCLRRLEEPKHDDLRGILERLRRLFYGAAGYLLLHSINREEEVAIEAARAILLRPLSDTESVGSPSENQEEGEEPSQPLFTRLAAMHPALSTSLVLAFPHALGVATTKHLLARYVCTLCRGGGESGLRGSCESGDKGMDLGMGMGRRQSHIQVKGAFRRLDLTAILSPYLDRNSPAIPLDDRGGVCGPTVASQAAKSILSAMNVARRLLFSSIVQWKAPNGQKRLINTGNLHQLTLPGLIQCQEALLHLYEEIEGRDDVADLHLHDPPVDTFDHSCDHSHGSRECSTDGLPRGAQNGPKRASLHHDGGKLLPTFTSVFLQSSEISSPMLAGVLSFLSYKRVCRLSCVNRTWRAICRSNILWRDLFVQRFDLQLPPSTLGLDPKNRPHADRSRQATKRLISQLMGPSSVMRIGHPRSGSTLANNPRWTPSGGQHWCGVFKSREVAYKSLCRHRTYASYVKAAKKMLKLPEAPPPACPQRPSLDAFRPHVCCVVGCDALITTEKLEKRHVARCHGAGSMHATMQKEMGKGKKRKRAADKQG